ncbi:MAG: hypothetical protein RL359_859 [Actinomycetota bacterium]|jgi:hypothetical protein
MSELFQILLSILVVGTLTIFISKRFRISKRYERPSRNKPPLDSWTAQDHGIDPSDIQREGEKP